MKTIYISIFLLLSLAGFGQNVKTVDFSGIEPLLHQTDDTTYVINFWATWCVPCVKEIPAFEKLNKKYKSEKLSVILVSVDFPSKIHETLHPFIKKYNIKSKVILLDDPDSNSWIDKVDPSWSGAIPATLIYKKSSRRFYEKPFTFEELDRIIQEKLKKSES